MKHAEYISLKKALQGAPPIGDHPDADALTAFSEGSLLVREREAVLVHLAICSECRHVLSITAEAAPIGPLATPALVKNRKWTVARIWIPSLSAAAIIILIGTLVVRNQFKIPGPPETVAKNKPAQQAESLPLEAGTSPQPAPASAFSNVTPSKALASAPAMPVTRPHWRINEQGQPERSFDNGPWLPVLPSSAPRMLVLSTYLEEVWAGGENSMLMRSFDKGDTWRVVLLPEKKGNKHAISHIRFSNAETITIQASDGTTWVSSDGGKSWN